MSTQLSLLDQYEEPSGPKVLTVSELTRRIKRTLETGFTSLSVEGEITNFKVHSSGHIYFSLKDSSALISAVMWRSRAPSLSFTPEDGMKVIATGRITLFEARGIYQIDVTSLRPVGVGELQIAFEKLKRKLAAEGLFDEERKKSLPRYPISIGIVTSETGAALFDMLHVFEKRFPTIEIVLCPVQVQGVGAGRGIARAVADFNDYGQVDLIIVARGGGSLEDLWAFNEEIVARAIVASHIPVVSAVGHEVDFTISDFVSDLRAPTPTAAAQLVVPDKSALLDTIFNYWYHSYRSIQKSIQFHKDRFRNLLRSYSFNRPLDLLRQYDQRVDELERSMTAAMTHKVSLLHAQTNSLRDQLAALDPQSILRRGYTIVRKNGRIAGSRRDVNTGDDIEITFHDGKALSKVS
ncbi:MAG: exodeoxyribonuclease VII large subunit [Ignavibacteriae bacterium]|nr:exodeoxyribonuclease VII large subunit [Ignavibacteriota bacterium]